MRLLFALLLLAPLAVGCAQTEPTATQTEMPVDSTEVAEAGEPPSLGPVMVGPMMAEEVYDAASLVGAMHDRYADRWYRTLSFTQATYRKAADGTVSEETWREWAALPGRLRIEMDDPMEGIDVLFVRDSTFLYRDGELAQVQEERNPLLTWGFDVYAQPPAETLRILEDEGYALDAFRTDVWDGREMYVLGEPERGEVWIERERLLFVRLVEPGQSDVRFLEYEPLADAWIAPRVEVWIGGDLVFWEEYADIQADVPLNPVLFDPRRWAEGVEASE